MVSIRKKCLVVSGVSFTTLIWWIVTATDVPILSCLVQGLLFIMAMVSLDIYRLQPSSYHSCKSLILHYLIAKVYQIVGTFAFKRYQNMTYAVKSSQEDALRSILGNASSSAFAKDHRLADIRTVKEFRNTIPLTDYESYLPYVDRILEGEDNVLFPQEVDYIATTSGTTSNRSKQFPKSSSLTRMISLRAISLYACCFSSIPGLERLRLILFTGTFLPHAKTKTGIKMGPASTATNITALPYWSTPAEAKDIPTEEHKYYVDLLFGLRDREIGALYAFIAPTLLGMFEVLEKHWKALCDDIEHGTLYSGIQVKPDIRKKLERLCTTDPTRAAQLRNEFSNGFDGIVPRIWPHCRVAFVISTGTFQVYADKLRMKYLGNIPVFSIGHMSTEGMLGINLWPEWHDINYAPLVGGNFYEWLATDEENPEPVLLHEVQLGRQYEMILTSFEGLYRYRTGDVVEFTKHYYQLPVYKFIQRSGDLLFLNTLKLPVVPIVDLMRKLVREENVDLVDYTFTESTHLEKPMGESFQRIHIVMFVEVEEDCENFSRLAHELDARLCEEREYYKLNRDMGRFQQCRIIRVRQGCFSRYKVKRLAQNPRTSTLQYKVPRITRDESTIQFFIEEALDL